MKTAIDRLVKPWSPFRRDKRGSLLVETAFVIPVLITLTLGGVEIARYALLNQKLDRLAMTTSDMVSQGDTISVPVLDAILSATGTIMNPFPFGADGVVIVTSVSKTGAAAVTVDWQRSGGGTMAGMVSQLGAPGQNATLPAGFTVKAGENAIFSETFYQFTPMFVSSVVDPSIVYHRAVFRPRQVPLKTLCPAAC